MRGRIAYAFPLVEGQKADVRAAAAGIGAAASDFGQTRRALGLTSLSVWLQEAPIPLVVLVFEGDLETYFERASSDAGIDEWFRDKIREWCGSDEVAELVYRYPQSEELFSWTLEP